MNSRLKQCAKISFRVAICVFVVVMFVSPQTARGQIVLIPEGVGVSVRAASYGVEIHVPIEVAPQWDIGFQGTLFWGDAYYNTLPEFYNAGLKARYFFPAGDKTRHYLAVIVAANGFEENESGSDGISYTPVGAAAYGVEHMLAGQWLGLGLELQGGLGVDAKGYAGLGVSLVFYR